MLGDTAGHGRTLERSLRIRAQQTGGNRLLQLVQSRRPCRGSHPRSMESIRQVRIGMDIFQRRIAGFCNRTEDTTRMERLEEEAGSSNHGKTHDELHWSARYVRRRRQ